MLLNANFIRKQKSERLIEGIKLKKIAEKICTVIL